MLFDGSFLDDIRRRVNHMRVQLPVAAAFFKTVALVSAYNYMLGLIDERVSQHPEVQRVPELKHILIAHFLAYPDRHIDVRHDRIFQPNALGTVGTLRAWQNAGHPARRTTNNYPKRLEYWKAIYNNEPMRIVRKPPKGVKTSPRPRTGDDIFDSPPPEDARNVLYELGRVHDRFGNIVTYEDVIYKRNLYFSGTDKLIPFWMPLNYGTDVGQQQGYPAVGGLHFIEDAERKVPEYLSRYAVAFERYATDSLTNPEFSSNSELNNLMSWTTKYNFLTFQDEYIPTIDYAVKLAYGVPF